jgi:glycosyltransferase involved in cell wall biosynthesis
MRVLGVNTVSILGGAERSLMDCVVGLARLGHEMAVACPAGPLAEALSSQGIAVYPLAIVRLHRPRLRRPLPVRGWFNLLVAHRQLRRVRRAFKPDWIHANSLTALLAVGRSAASPALCWHVRDLALHPAAARLGARRARALIAISPAVAAHLRALLPGDLHDRIHLIPNGIVLPDSSSMPGRGEARRMLGLPADVPLVGMLAHFAPWKRHDRLIAAAARLAIRQPEARVVLAGDDACGEHACHLRRLRRQIAAGGGGARRVILWGPAANPLLFLRALDVLVHPADAEPFGRVICEAMAVGTPVIAMNRGGPRDILADGESGLLVDSDSPEALADAIDRLLRDAGRRRRLAEEAGLRVRERFDIRRTVQQIDALYAAGSPAAAPPPR